MGKGTRGRYALEFKQEAVRLVESGQTMAAAARSLGVVEQTPGNWIKLHRAGRLKGASDKRPVTAEQMEISRLRAELARDILPPQRRRPVAGDPGLGKAAAYCVLRRRPLYLGRKLCFIGDEGRALGTGLQEQVSNHIELHWLRASVVSVEEKAGQ
jgi:transposase